MSQTIRLSDGRALSYAHYGNSTGKPVFVCHGFPGSRLDWHLFNEVADLSKSNARILVPDRPGMGHSDFKHARSILDWPEDLTGLADCLGIDRFAVLGISGGGPYAAACAYTLSDRLTHVAIVSGMGPSEAPWSTIGTAWTLPGKNALIRRIILKLMALGISKDPGKVLKKMLKSLEGPDRALFAEHPELGSQIIDSWKEAFVNGIRGVQHDATLYTRPWGFRLGDVEEKVDLWHGECDTSVPVSVGRYIADALPNCDATILKNEGHFSAPYNHITEVLEIITA